MAIKLYSTLSRKKELFETIEPGKVRMYVCGVTVYNKAHIGHAIRAEDHLVGQAGDEMLAGHLVAELEPRQRIRGAGRLDLDISRW